MPIISQRHFVLRWKGKKDVLVLTCGLFLALCVKSQAQVNVSFSSTAPTSLQTEFIAGATSQYLSVLTKSPYFGNTWSLTISGKNPNYQPPAVSSPILTGTAFQECFVHGYAFGLEDEREDDLWLLDALKNNILLTGSCGGLIAGTTVAADAYLSGCWQAYGVAQSTISLRNGMTPKMILQ